MSHGLDLPATFINLSYLLGKVYNDFVTIKLIILKDRILNLACHFNHAYFDVYPFQNSLPYYKLLSKLHKQVLKLFFFGQKLPFI